MDELYQSARLGPQPLLGSAWYVETKSRPSFRPRRIAGPPGGESAPSADRRVPSTRARASTGKTPVVLARHHRSRAPGKEGTAERSDARGGRKSGSSGEESWDGEVSGAGHSPKSKNQRSPSQTARRTRGGRAPTSSSKSALSTVEICDAFATESLGRPVWRRSSSVFPGALACALLLVSTHTTTVLIRLALTSSRCRTSAG